MIEITCGGSDEYLYQKHLDKTVINCDPWFVHHCYSNVQVKHYINTFDNTLVEIIWLQGKKIRKFRYQLTVDVLTLISGLVCGFSVYRSSERINIMFGREF